MSKEAPKQTWGTPTFISGVGDSQDLKLELPDFGPHTSMERMSAQLEGIVEQSILAPKEVPFRYRLRAKGDRILDGEEAQREMVRYDIDVEPRISVETTLLAKTFHTIPYQAQWRGIWAETHGAFDVEFEYIPSHLTEEALVDVIVLVDEGAHNQNTVNTSKPHLTAFFNRFRDYGYDWKGSVYGYSQDGLTPLANQTSILSRVESAIDTVSWTTDAGNMTWAVDEVLNTHTFRSNATKVILVVTTRGDQYSPRPSMYADASAIDAHRAATKSRLVDENAHFFAVGPEEINDPEVLGHVREYTEDTEGRFIPRNAPNLAETFSQAGSDLIEQWLRQPAFMKMPFTYRPDFDDIALWDTLFEGLTIEDICLLGIDEGYCGEVSSSFDVAKVYVGGLHPDYSGKTPYFELNIPRVGGQIDETSTLECRARYWHTVTSEIQSYELLAPTRADNPEYFRFRDARLLLEAEIPLSRELYRIAGYRLVPLTEGIGVLYFSEQTLDTDIPVWIADFSQFDEHAYHGYIEHTVEDIYAHHEWVTAITPQMASQIPMFDMRGDPLPSFDHGLIWIMECQTNQPEWVELRYDEDAPGLVELRSIVKETWVLEGTGDDETGLFHYSLTDRETITFLGYDTGTEQTVSLDEHTLFWMQGEESNSPYAYAYLEGLSAHPIRKERVAIARPQQVTIYSPFGPTSQPFSEGELGEWLSPWYEGRTKNTSDHQSQKVPIYLGLHDPNVQWEYIEVELDTQTPLETEWHYPESSVGERRTNQGNNILWVWTTQTQRKQITRAHRSRRIPINPIPVDYQGDNKEYEDELPRSLWNYPMDSTTNLRVLIHPENPAVFIEDRDTVFVRGSTSESFTFKYRVNMENVSLMPWSLRAQPGIYYIDRHEYAAFGHLHRQSNPLPEHKFVTLDYFPKPGTPVMVQRRTPPKGGETE